jgi:hypothetical protein
VLLQYLDDLGRDFVHTLSPTGPSRLTERSESEPLVQSRLVNKGHILKP